MTAAVVVIPVFNENSTLIDVLKELRKSFSGPVVLVDDGSTDGSCAQPELSEIDNLQILTHSTNRGYGAALQSGFAHAIHNNFKYVVTMDCDEQHEPVLVKEFIRMIETGSFDIVSGTRYLSCCLQVDEAPADRVKINKLITARLNALFAWQLSDAFCGFKAYTVDILRQLKITEPGYAMPLQLWVQLGALRARINELAVPRIYKNLSRSFGVELDNPETRLKYYEDVITAELEKWNVTT